MQEVSKWAQTRPGEGGTGDQNQQRMREKKGGEREERAAGERGTGGGRETLTEARQWGQVAPSIGR
jgi:hypothetical protein